MFWYIKRLIITTYCAPIKLATLYTAYCIYTVGLGSWTLLSPLFCLRNPCLDLRSKSRRSWHRPMQSWRDVAPDPHLTLQRDLLSSSMWVPSCDATLKPDCLWSADSSTFFVHIWRFFINTTVSGWRRGLCLLAVTAAQPACHSRRPWARLRVRGRDNSGVMSQRIQYRSRRIWF